jgi:hypothetical protein
MPYSAELILFISRKTLLGHIKNQIIVQSNMSCFILTDTNTNSGDALEQNFVFSSLDNVEKQMLANAMEQVEVMEGEHLITQGAKYLNMAILYGVIVYSIGLF